ncbi:PREDICTED: pancreatic lipase-related protein 2-like [Papilio xuthus]|uniref:Pancreatic lipase-related protein 2-like n=1 Tax=Papilio xuthus TaxID=66420 RepID=A0AAJ6ZU54_PAPXU|nr:PREDICTED: pancreatic lipase-related protein 2-like [Papilio xuthus]
MFKALFLFAVYVHTATANEQRSGSANRYFVYTRGNFNDPREIIVNDLTTITESGVELTRDTVVIVHGHKSTAFNSLNPTVKNAYLQNFDVNVIVVDWSAVARLDYKLSVASVPSVGAAVGDLISLLLDANRVDLRRIHLVGFNLGAHVVGFAGRRLQGRVARITGLDPSAKQWDNNSGRLSASDAQYVEVIHTDSEGLFSNGLRDAIGDVDFYPNGGSKQPGCGLSNSCSHNRAWELFAATLREDNELSGNSCSTFIQLSWNRCNGDPLVMGDHQFSKPGSGIYRVNTRSSAPF